jgi:hypothetical protein
MVDELPIQSGYYEKNISCRVTTPTELSRIQMNNINLHIPKSEIVPQHRCNQDKLRYKITDNTVQIVKSSKFGSLVEVVFFLLLPDRRHVRLKVEYMKFQAPYLCKYIVEEWLLTAKPAAISIRIQNNASGNAFQKAELSYAILY